MVIITIPTQNIGTLKVRPLLGFHSWKVEKPEPGQIWLQAYLRGSADGSQGVSSFWVYATIGGDSAIRVMEGPLSRYSSTYERASWLQGSAPASENTEASLQTDHQLCGQ